MLVADEIETCKTEMLEVLIAGTGLPAAEFEDLLREVLAEVRARAAAPGVKRARLLFYGCINDDVSLIRERIIDSLGVVELAAFLSRRFGVRVEQSEVRPENFDTVTRLAAFVRLKQSVSRPEPVPAN